MGARLTYGTAGATGGGWSCQPGTLQPAFEESWHGPNWCFQRRSQTTYKDNYGWRSGWGFGCRVGGGTDSPEYATVAMNDLVSPGLFAPYSCDGPGTQTMRFILGDCVNDSLVPIANPTVQAFVTSTDAFAGEVQGNTDGTYVLPVNTLPGVQHYLVAYKAGAPDIGGTSVNTITSTNVDGT